MERVPSPADSASHGDPRVDLLRHFLATLAYRTQKALRGAPPEYADHRVAPNARTPHELVWHMTGLMGYVVVLFRGGVWQPDRLDTFDEEIRRFHAQLERVDELLRSEPLPAGVGPERLLQGPLADAMTHAGQLAILRRCVGDPVAPENFLRADVDVRELGPEQPPPRAPKEGWSPDQPPPAPGRPLR